MSLPVRRSMSAALKTADTLSDQEKAFLVGASPKPVVVMAPAIEAPARFDVTPPPAQEENKIKQPPASEIQKPQRQRASQPKTEPLSDNLVGLTFRVPIELHHALMRASFERKLNKDELWSQQDIAAEALHDWFKKNGYL
jgi:hypothetical protein